MSEPSHAVTEKQGFIDAAVRIVEGRAADARPGEMNEYVEGYVVAIRMREAGTISHVDADSLDLAVRENARFDMEGKVHGLLDEAVAAGRILRFSSRDNELLPRLDGTRRSLYGNAVAYTTPELHDRCLEAVADATAQAEAEQAEMDVLLERAEARGLPDPVESSANSVTFDRAGFAALLGEEPGR